MNPSTTRRIRLLQVVGNAIVGGMETFVERLVGSLPTEHFDVSCLCPFESTFTAKLRAHGARVHVTPMPDDPTLSSIQFASALVRSASIDVIHAHLSNAHLLAGLAGSLTGTPVLATVHGRAVPTMDFEVYRLCRTKMSVVCQNAYLHALSLGVAMSDVQLIPNGVDASAYEVKAQAALRTRFGLAPGIPLVGFVGRLAPEKNPGLFIRSALLIHQVRPEVHFVLVGDGPLLLSLRNEIKRIDAQGYIHLAGEQSNMGSVYASLDLMIMTSNSEGMPLALMEAMAAGVPVVATQVGGIPEILDAGTTGLLAPVGDADALSNHALELLVDADRRQRMALAARQRVTLHFTQQRSCASMMALLDRLAARRVGGSSSATRLAVRGNFPRDRSA